MAVSRRASKRAVGRNRLKRIIRESFRAHQAQFADGASDEENLLAVGGGADIRDSYGEPFGPAEVDELLHANATGLTVDGTAP